jgi:Flp pilus assembly pilin Flp
MTPHRGERLQSVTVTAQCIYFPALVSCNVFATKDLPHSRADLFRDHPGIPRAYSHSAAQFSHRRSNDEGRARNEPGGGEVKLIKRRVKMLATLRRLWHEEEAQDLTEYALLLVLLSLAAVAFLGTLAKAIGNVFSNAASNLTSATP